MSEVGLERGDEGSEPVRMPSQRPEVVAPEQCQGTGNEAHGRPSRPGDLESPSYWGIVSPLCWWVLTAAHV